jgi:hypothetical protein
VEWELEPVAWELEPMAWELEPVAWELLALDLAPLGLGVRGHLASELTG